MKEKGRSHHQCPEEERSEPLQANAFSLTMAKTSISTCGYKTHFNKLLSLGEPVSAWPRASFNLKQENLYSPMLQK